MTIAIPGYTATEPLFENVNTLVYRGYRQSDQMPVIIKTPKAEYPTPREIARLQHEYRLTHDLNLPGISRAYALEDFNNGLVLIQEDFGGVALIDLIQSHQLNLAQGLQVILTLSETLAELHQLQIIHKDIKPHNIIVNLETGQVKLTDFGIATQLSRESQILMNPTILEGTLAYISPEQTGRMNRLVDYRTDYYSLGVTLYEVLTGQLPFTGNDPMELIHSHIARQPLPPHEVKPELPPVLSRIVLKLMAKTAEERYQSSQGLAFDLRECLRQLEETGTIKEFEIARRDISDRFEISQKLYGREQEAATLMKAFERVNQGVSELMLVYGYSGIGKSALIHEIHRPLVQSRGYFISGKFDQFQRGIPYSSVIQAFRELMQQLLTESEAQLQTWRDKLLSALGNNAQIIIDVIPSVETIIGPQPEVPDLPPAESQNRFNKVVQDFVRVFAQPDHPLVMFLDDLQWVDTATLKLIEVLTTNLDSKHLLLIGAYRDNEVSPSHPLMLTLDNIQKSGAIVNHVCLQPLGSTDVRQLTADSLRCSAEAAAPLAELIFNKTQGNPFFITEFLKFTYQEGLLHFNASERYWQWDLPGIEALNVTANVVDLMTRKVTKLEPQTQSVLQLAACIGNRFDLETLAVVNEKPPAETASELWEAILAGLIVPLQDTYKFAETLAEMEASESNEWNVTYKFLHDRVQQAVYGLITREDLSLLHLRIGRLLLESTPEAEREDKLFDIVNHLNSSIDLITDQQERVLLAGLNLQAGVKAKSATAYEAAYSYLNTGLSLLPENSWETEYNLSFQLTLTTAECAYLSAQSEIAEKLANAALENARTNLDKARIYNLKILLYEALNQMAEAIGCGCQGMALFGIYLPTQEQTIKMAVEEELRKVNSNLGECSVGDLINLPEMVDPEKQAIMSLLDILNPPAYMFSKDLWTLLMLIIVNFSIKEGLSNVSSVGYSCYGTFLAAKLGNFKLGYDYGQLGLKVAEKYNSPHQKCTSSYVLGVTTAPWVKPIRSCRSYLISGYQNGLEAGSFFWAQSCILQLILESLECGFTIDECLQEAQRYADFFKKHYILLQIYLYATLHQSFLKLKGIAENPFRLSLTNEIIDEREFETRIRALTEQSYVHHCFVLNLFVYYFLENYQSALSLAVELAPDIHTVLFAQLQVAEHTFYYSLTLTAVYESASPEEQQQYWQTLEANQQQMRIWADNCEANFLHKYLLVAAEMARLSNQPGQAADLYDQAIDSAHTHQFTHCEALANELAGKFYLAQGKRKIARTYLQEARLGYLKWGAGAKVALLDAQFAELLAIIPVGEFGSQLATETLVAVTSSTTTGSGRILDLMTVIKASQALSSEIVLDNLLERLLRIVLENAGARKSVFILAKDDQLMIEAIGTVEPQPAVTLQSIPLDHSEILPKTLINYGQRTQETIVLDEISQDDRFGSDPYVIQHQPRSVLCLPVIHQRRLIGLLYLENNLVGGAFTLNRLEILRLLMAQVATSIDNANLYADLTRYSRELEDSFENLKKAQLQLIQSEKMSSLGLLMAGVAHEINNPISFLSSNLEPANQYVQDLLDLLAVYAQAYPDPTPEVQDKIEEIDLEFTREDLPRLLNSMDVGVDRIRQLSVSLRNFARSDQTSKSAVNLHDGIDSTLMILEHRLKAKPERPRIQIVKEYGTLPLIHCYAGQLNQVFMNLIANAIDALDEFAQGKSYQELETNPGQITITTEWVTTVGGVLSDHSPSLPFARIRIKDNGPGMPESVRERIFESMFTTKAVGKGTGLGLSISQQIVVEKHKGRIDCVSTPGDGAEFIVEIPGDRT